MATALRLRCDCAALRSPDASSQLSAPTTSPRVTPELRASSMAGAAATPPRASSRRVFAIVGSALALGAALAVFAGKGKSVSTPDSVVVTPFVNRTGTPR